ncbi:hypothetical protein BDW22DRAFT_1097934 [Trametopsis cervina]|nr:hypothetical protein BDW22DRAFT_1097934 [Trametopsis cervina]
MEERQAREYEAAEYGVPRTRSRRYSTAASPVVIRAESSGGFADVPYTNPVSMHGRAGSTGSAGFLGSGSPYAGAGASPMPMPMAGGRSSPYGGPEGSPYGMSGFAGAGTSPYAGGAGLAGMPASVGAGSAYGGAGAGGYGGGMGVPASTGPMYNTTPPVGNSFGVPGSTAGGMAYAGGGGGGITFPGGYQPGAMGNPASQMYGANPPSPYGGGAGLPAQSAGYATSQPGYAGSGYNQPMYAQQQQPQQMYADPSMNGMNGRGGGVTTVIANGRAIPAPAGSTITIDTKRKGRSRRVSTSGYEHPRHRSRSVDPLRHEQSMGYTLAAAR